MKKIHEYIKECEKRKEEFETWQYEFAKKISGIYEVKIIKAFVLNEKGYVHIYKDIKKLAKRFNAKVKKRSRDCAYFPTEKYFENEGVEFFELCR